MIAPANRANDLHDTIIPALLTTAKMIRSMMAINLSALGLQIGQEEVLLAFERSRPMSPDQLAAKLNIRPDTAAKLLSRLVQQHLAMRVEDTTDPNAMVVVITASGAEMQVRLRIMLESIDRELHSALDGSLVDAMHSEVALLNARLFTLLTPQRPAQDALAVGSLTT